MSDRCVKKILGTQVIEGNRCLTLVVGNGNTSDGCMMP